MNNKKGFTILEITVSISIFTIAIILAGSLYLLGQKSYNKGSDRAELSQNARVISDRISRELRQTLNIVTTLPEMENEPRAEEIFFQDGHDISQITYIRYYLTGTDLIRQTKSYYFASEPTTYVAYNSLDQNGNPPLSTVLSDNVVGEYFNKFEFWGTSGLIHLAVGLNKGQNSAEIATNIYKRN